MSLFGKLREGFRTRPVLAWSITIILALLCFLIISGIITAIIIILAIIITRSKKSKTVEVIKFHNLNEEDDENVNERLLEGQIESEEESSESFKTKNSEEESAESSTKEEDNGEENEPEEESVESFKNEEDSFDSLIKNSNNIFVIDNVYTLVKPKSNQNIPEDIMKIMKKIIDDTHSMSNVSYYDIKNISWIIDDINKDVVGYVNFIEKPDDILHLELLGFSTEYKGKSIAKKILKKILEHHLNKRKIYTLNVFNTNEPAIGFYENVFGCKIKNINNSTNSRTYRCNIDDYNENFSRKQIN